MKPSRKTALIALVVVASLPFVAWATFKPVRILAPELNGVTCTGRVCVEDAARLPRAIRLQQAAMARTAEDIGPLERPPLTVFCSTRECYRSFGGGLERGATLLDWGVILPSESWQTYLVEHEYIHMLQAEKLGLIGRQRTPDWFKEGMPFFISQPPDFDLPDYARPLVAKYRACERRVGRRHAWSAIRELD